MKRILVSLIMLISLLSASSQIEMNGKRVVADWSRGLLLCSMAEADFGVSHRVLFTHDSTVTMLKVNEVLVDADSIDLPAIDAYTRLPVEVLMTDSTTLTAELQFTFLPIVEFSGEINRTTYVTVPFHVMLPDADDVHELAKVRYRGSLINTDAVVKRAYHIKFVNEGDEKMDVKLFGLRSDNSWILDGGAADLFRIRNRVACDLWNDMAVKPYYSAQEPKALSASRGQMVEMFVDGDYRGMYNMCEAMDRKQMKLKKYDAETLEIHGQLWKSDDRSLITLFDSIPPVRPTGRNANYNLFETKYPDLEEVTPTNYDLLYNLGQLCSQADDSTFAAQIDSLLDIPVVMDHYIFLQVLQAFDNQGKNLYWACYDRTADPKLTMAVWDLDASFGMDWKATTTPHSQRVQPWHHLYRDFGNHHSFLRRLIELDVDSFNARVIDRYHALREGPLATQSLIDRFAATVDMLNRCGAADREKWRYSPDPWLRRNIDINEELDYVTNWITQHMDYLDDCVFIPEYFENGDVNHDGKVDVLDINELLNMMLFYAPQRGRGDANRDQLLDIEDVNYIVNTILELLQPSDD